MADYQVSVSYGGNKIIPAPYISLQEDIQRSADGTARNYLWKVVVKGKITAWKGSPLGDGTFWKMPGYPPDETTKTDPSVLNTQFKAKLAAMTNLFNQDGLWLEIQNSDGSAPIKFMPRIVNFVYQDGPWFNWIDYTIEMEADYILFGDVPNIRSTYSDTNNPPEETWSLEIGEEARPTYKLQHTVSLNAKNRFKTDGTGAIDKYGWELAKASVDANLGYDSTIPQTTFGLSSDFNPFNYVANKQLDSANGKYSVTETWVLSRTNYTEDFTVDNSYSAETGLNSVRVSGTITGLQTGTDQTTRYTNAEARAEVAADPAGIWAVAQTMTGIALNPAPLTTSITRNKPSGVITYSIEFNNRVALPSGMLTYSITISLDNAVPVTPEIGVINRKAGPIIQDTGSSTQQSCSIQVDFTVSSTYSNPALTIPTYDPYPDFIAAVGGVPSIVYVKSDKPTWVPRQGRYSRSTTYIYQ